MIRKEAKSLKAGLCDEVARARRCEAGTDRIDGKRKGWYHRRLRRGKGGAPFPNPREPQARIEVELMRLYLYILISEGRRIAKRGNS
jgi:hypothetical protein